MGPEMTADWIVPDWPLADRVGALITSRNGGTSTGAFSGAGHQGGMNLGLYSGDEPDRVLANRALLLHWLPNRPCWMRQVHGCRVVDAADFQHAPIEPEADAMLAYSRRLVCTVQAADCMPVLLADEAAEVVAIAHAGWRGLAAGVIEGTVAAMGRPAGRLMAFLGPAIGRDAFEVGPDVKAAFTAHDTTAETAFRTHGREKWLADLEGLVRMRLNRAGVARIFGGGRCTVNESDHFYSYRRDRITGRMAAFIWLT